jgi:3-hydroxyacyl-[acyl-carrier-protein] dehydratase
MLKDSLFTITSLAQQEGSINATLKVNADDPIFKGHFPNQPVLPGACLLQMLKEVLETALDARLRMKKADNIKFLTLIDPLQQNMLQLTITYKPADNNELFVTANLSAGANNCFKFKGVFVGV